MVNLCLKDNRHSRFDEDHHATPAISQHHSRCSLLKTSTAVCLYLGNPKISRKDKRRPRFSFFISNCQRTRVRIKSPIVRRPTSVVIRQSFVPALTRKWLISETERSAMANPQQHTVSENTRYQRRQGRRPKAAPPSSMAAL
jgi:hypothetical protein